MLRSTFKRLNKKSKKLKKETYTIYLVYKDSRVSWWKKFFLAMVIGYAFSPIDLIPDFIPILGYLDDLIIVPIGIWLAIRLISTEIFNDCRKLSQERERTDIPVGKKTAFLIVFIWLLGLVMILLWIIKTIKRVV